MADEKLSTVSMLNQIASWVNGKIELVKAYFPSQADPTTNQLADKAFVNSSIATATATFRGTYNVVSDLSLSYNATHAQIQTALDSAISTVDNNDYAFVQIPTSATATDIAKVEKYKFNGTAWGFEYELNNSGFTASQWAAINSGATLELIGKLSDLPTNAELTTLLNAKADKSEMSITDGTGSDSDKTTITLKSGTSATVLTQHQDVSGKEDSSNKVTTLSGESTDTEYPSAKCVYDFVVGSGIAKEVLTVTASADSGSVSSAVLTVKANEETLKTGTGSITVAIDFGTEYTVEAARVNDYLTPAVQSFTAGQSVRNVTMAYTYIPRDTITLDQTESVDTSMITGDVQGDVIKAIRAASHLYLGTQTESGNQLICQLKDNEGAKYADGSSAALDGTEGDHWLKLPVFWYKVTPIGTADANGAYDKYSFSFAFAGEPDSTWKKWNGDKNLLGAHKMYVNDSKGYSRSGIVGSANFTQPNGKTYARARGTGYTTVTWEWHCMMCVLFYAWYGRTNAQAQCGTGSNSNTRTLGTKDSLGMTDTTSSNGNADNTKFWGIENWWGDINEWIDNITSSNYALTVVGQDDGVSRSAGTIVACAGTGGWQSRMKISEKLDMVPVAKEGTETTYYCDWVNANTGSRVVARSVHYASPFGGVAFVNAYFDSSSANAYIGSRLAFNGTIVEAESVAAYKAALNS